ncbi:NAD(P)H-dependent flavin oxidoreductase [Pseudomonas sp. SDO528_S397]
MWYETPATKRLGIKYPIIQGPFGGGPSSVELVSAVSNAGGLGSFGMQSLEPAQMIELARQIRHATSQPFAINLWMSNTQETSPSPADVRQAGELLRPYYAELGQEVPTAPESFIPDVGDQLDAILEIKPPVFSFVFGIPSAAVLAACKSLGILTMGTATTVEEAKALETAGVDCIVASGFEAGGHKGSFLKSAEESLTGIFSLVPQVVDNVAIPVIAAGGVADARGVAAALALGAHGVQIGTAFLACKESAASAYHQRALRGSHSGATTLTKAFTGRLARSIANRMTIELSQSSTKIAPYPLQAWFMGNLSRLGRIHDREDFGSFSAGQSASLIRHDKARDLMEELVRETPNILRKHCLNE